MERGEIEPPTDADLIVDYLENAFRRIRNIFLNLKRALYKLSMDAFNEAKEHPIMATYISVAITFSIFPFLCFLLFAFLSVTFVAGVFLFFEGMILFAGFTLLSWILLAMISLAFIFSSIFIASYYICQYIRFYIPALKEFAFEKDYKILNKRCL